MGTSSKFADQFQQYAHQIDQVNERRERLVKASRDLTMYSKKVIFQLHRAVSANRKVVLEQAAKDLETVKNSHMTRIARELQGEDYWRFRSAYTSGMQEFIEAATFLHYCTTNDLLRLDELNAAIAEILDSAGRPFEASLEDYLLGVADLTGELMRLAISSIAAGQQEAASLVCNFLRSLHENFSNLPKNSVRELGKKLSVMEQSLLKVENAIYMLHVRGSEYPPEIIVSRLERPEEQAS